MQSRTTVVTTSLECGNNSDCDYYHIIMVFHWAYCTPQTRDNSVKYSNRFSEKIKQSLKRVTILINSKAEESKSNQKMSFI